MKRVYYGWYVVFSAMLIHTLVIGASMSAFGLFVLPVSSEFKLSRADTNTVVILLNIGAALMAPFVGWLLDRMPAKPILAAGALLFGVSYAILGASHSLWLSAAVVAVVLPIAYTAAQAPMSVLIVRWFTVQRGRALTLGAVGLSLGGILVSPVAGVLIERVGWRMTLWVLGGAVSALLLLIALSLRERRGPQDVEGGAAAVATTAAPRAADAAAAKPLAPGALLRMPQFWSIGLGVAVPLAISQAIAISLAPLGLEGGLSMAKAASLISLAGVMSIGGKLLLAVVADKVDRILLLTAVFCLGAVANAALFMGQGYLLLLLCAAVFGLSAGITVPLFGALLADRFGPASFGTVRGLMAPLIAVAGAVFVRLAGEVFDRTGGYDMVFVIFGGLQLASALLIFTTRFTAPAAASAPPAAGAASRA